jgi:polyhydroxybutyrate depolymerase
MNDRLQAGADFKRTLTVAGRDRWYTGHVSTKWDGASPLPLIAALHGATSNPHLMERFCGLSEKADDAGFAVIYPAGTGNTANVLTWNGGACCGYAVRHQVDDVASLDAIFDDVGAALPIDRNRVFLAGMSNGAHMAYRYTSVRAERIRALACVAGPMAIALPSLARPTPLIHIHGTDDEFAPFNGGKGPKSPFGAHLPSVLETILAWVRANGLPETPRVDRFPDTAGDGTTIERRTFGPKQGVDVVLYVVEGGGHTWPGMPPLPLVLGKSSANLNANDVIWEFFRKL